MKKGQCRDPVISFVDSQQLAYLQACIKESLRVSPPGSVGLQRVAPDGGVTIGERTFPAGTILSVYTSSLLVSKEIWGPDAGEFKPERWLDPGISALEKYFVPVGLVLCYSPPKTCF